MVYKLKSCEIERLLPYNAILPSRALNFYMLDQSCHRHGKFSTLQNHKLQIYCKIMGAHIVKHPNFLTDRSDANLPLAEMDRLTHSSKKEEKIMYTGGNGISVDDSEVIRAFCHRREDFYVQNIVKKDVLKRATRIIESKNESHKPLNIMILMINGLSRAHFERRLPKTVNVLNDIMHGPKNSLYQFFRYNAVGLSSESTSPSIFSQYEEETNDQSKSFLWHKQTNERLADSLFKITLKFITIWIVHSQITN